MASSGEIFRNLAAAGAVTMATLGGSGAPAAGAEPSHSPDASGQGMAQPGIMPSQSGEQFAFVNWPARGNHFDLEATPTATVESGDETTVIPDNQQPPQLPETTSTASTKLDLASLMSTDGNWEPIPNVPQWKIKKIPSPFPNDRRPYEEISFHDGPLSIPDGTQANFGSIVPTSAGFPYIGRGGIFLVQMDIAGDAYSAKGGFSITNGQPSSSENHRGAFLLVRKGGTIELDAYDTSRSQNGPYMTNTYPNAFNDSSNLSLTLGIRLSPDGKSISAILPDGTLTDPMDLGDSSFFYSGQTLMGAKVIGLDGHGYKSTLNETMLVRPQGR